MSLYKEHQQRDSHASSSTIYHVPPGWLDVVISAAAETLCGTDARIIKAVPNIFFVSENELVSRWGR